MQVQQSKDEKYIYLENKVAQLTRVLEEERQAVQDIKEELSKDIHHLDKQGRLILSDYMQQQES